MNNQPYSSDPRVPEYPQQQPVVANPGVVNDHVRSANAGEASMESRSSNYVDPSGNVIENQSVVYEDKNVERANMRYWSRTIIYFILAVLETILGLRFIFRLLGASQDNGFIGFLYGLTHVFVAPFNGIFNDQTLSATHGNVFELSTLVAMLIYALICWGLVALSRVAFSPNYSSRQQVLTTRRRQ